MKNLLQGFVCLFLILTSTAPALGQARFLDDGQNGAGLAVGYGLADDFTVLDGDFTYVFGGRHEMGLGFARFSYDEHVFGPNADGTGIAPHIATSILRPNPRSSFGLEIGARYESGTFGSDFSDSQKLEISSSAVMAGATLYMDNSSQREVHIIPSLRVDYVKHKAKSVDADGLEDSAETNGLVYEAGVNLLFNSGVWLGVAYQEFKSEGTLGFRVGYSFPTG